MKKYSDIQVTGSMLVTGSMIVDGVTTISGIIEATSSIAVTSSYATTASIATRTNRVTPTGWQLYSTDTDFWNGGSQNVPTITPNYTILSGSSVTFTVPSGFSNTKVLFNMHNWGDVYISNVGMGALRYAISGSLVGGLASGIAMTSWTCPLPAGSTPRWNATTVWQLTNVTPGTYDVRFGVGREAESGTINAVIAWGTETKVEVFIQP